MQAGGGVAGDWRRCSVVDPAHRQAAALRHPERLLRPGVRDHLHALHRLLLHRGSHRGLLLSL